MHALERRDMPFFFVFFFLASHRNSLGLVCDEVGWDVIKPVMCCYKLLILFYFFNMASNPYLNVNRLICL